MDSQSQQQQQQLHFVVFPLMVPGHMIPMMDIAKILSQHNAVVTVVTTPQNASRFTSTFASYIESGYQIRLAQIPFPEHDDDDDGLPQGCENLDMLPSLGNALALFNAASSLQQPVEKLFQELSPPPSCIISDVCLPYTIHVANKFNIPRITFRGVSCFYLLSLHNIGVHKVRESVADETEYFLVPGIPDKVEMTLAQLSSLTGEKWKKFYEEVNAAEMASYGKIMNSIEEFEPVYTEEYKKVSNNKVWCVGPVSLSNMDQTDKAQRGNNKASSSVDDWQHLTWLDSQKPRSVIYACFGSICNLTAPQLKELGLALEASKRPFIWVIREGKQLEELEKWIQEDGFEERTKDRGVIIRGWAPQLLILSHPAIGGFLTHSGWNSVLEAICAGVPMVTWPLFGDHFSNEVLIVQLLEVGVKIGVESPTRWGAEEEGGVVVKKEEIVRAIEKLMDESASEMEEMRKRVKELGEVAKNAVQVGGSSHSNWTLLIQDIMHKSSMTKGDI